MSEETLRFEYEIPADDFTRAGEASGSAKKLLKSLGLDPDVIRKVAIAMYEGEINTVIHAGGGKAILEITPESVDMTLIDQGPGIADIDLAMQEGYSTAPDQVRKMCIRDSR